MKICQLIYASRATNPMSREELAAITAQSASNNQKLNITGALLLCDNYFVQLLEGDDEVALRDLFHRICKDPRHQDVELLEVKPAKARLFADWGMSSLHEESASPADRARIEQIISRIKGQEKSPRLCVDAMKLLRHLHTAIEQHSRAAA
jgi:hypothetical protein